MDFGVLWAMPAQVIDLLTIWRGVFGHHHNRLCGKIRRILLCKPYGKRVINGLLRMKKQSLQAIKNSFFEIFV